VELQDLIFRHNIQNHVIKSDYIDLDIFQLPILWDLNDFTLIKNKFNSKFVEYIQFSFDFSDQFRFNTDWDDLEKFLKEDLLNLKGICFNISLLGLDFKYLNEDNLIACILCYLEINETNFSRNERENLLMLIKKYWMKQFLIFKKYDVQILTNKEFEKMEETYCENEWKLFLRY